MRFAVWLWLGLLPGLHAESVWQEAVEFQVNHDAGPGNSVFLAGSSPALGSWDTSRAVRLRWTSGNVWRGTVSLSRGVPVVFRPFVRSEAASAFTNSGAITWLLSDQTNLPGAPPSAPHPGKIIYYSTGWTNPQVLWRNPGGSWSNISLRAVGPGRSAAETLFLAEGVGIPGRPIEFAPNSGTGLWDNPGGVSGANYLAWPDAIWLQDGQIYSYQPPANPSAPRIVTNTVGSTQPGISGRRVRVLLPRGYDQNGSHRYPVLYLHDGQNVFDPGGAFGSWSADATVSREIFAGRIREILVVAIDNTSDRMNEYRPPGDLYNGADGLGNRYRDYLIDNVKTWVDTNFRTSSRSTDQAVMGSSLGGLISHYIGTTRNTFGLLGLCSPSYWIAPNFRASLASGTGPARRIWMDWGSAEGSSMWDYSWPMAETLDTQGMVRGRDLQVLVGAGDGHNEAAWARRLPEALRFLFPVTDGGNDLLLRHYGVPNPTPNLASGSFTLTLPTLRGFHYRLVRTASLGASWNNAADTIATDPWGTATFTDPSPATTSRQFYRIEIQNP